ncbi:GNAT family N-acetyltransferase [Proteiniclasticum sp. QWL-01]|uniref:GNAT family N-acetyltransferase n=1 Tax=Proteiniclasticum sp. QWL-01 TaxID=3036945 RepID=UPI002202BEC6|nr:GNAT family N-acetyltransferase [Proteiniclasticum sp. QWL-01]UUM11855.1 GNAT family N-acetyltransferase [Clostridiaceae bacterium HFYG-1003]WFF73346.1 GNAT family N-acetyltransferase [Proteiniclasticum sp. QWL-01]
MTYQLHSIEGEEDRQKILEIFQSNPGYFLMFQGRTAQMSDVLSILEERPPGDPLVDKQFCLIEGQTGQGSRPAAVADWLRDYPEAGIWYVGLFMTAASLHGTGQSRAIYRWLEEQLRSEGAVRIRLAVLRDNHRALRFWHNAGFRETDRRTHAGEGVTHQVIVLEKHLMTRD